MKPSMAFTQQHIKTQKETYQPGSDLVTNLSCTLNGFTGTVTNQTGYDLKNVVICYNSYYVYLGDLKNGESANIELADLKPLSYVSYDMSDWMAETPQELFFARTEENRKLLDNQNVYNIMETIANSLTTNQGVVFGMIDNYESDLVQKKDTKVYAAAVAVSYFNQIPEEYQKYAVFINSINDYMVGGDNISYTDAYPQVFDYFYDTSDLDMYGEDEMQVLYDFSYLDLTGAKLINTDYAANGDNGGDYYYGPLYSNVQLYNYTTQTYEDVFDENGMSGDLTPYVNEQGWMQIRYYTDNPDEWYYAPNISLVGGER